MALVTCTNPASVRAQQAVTVEPLLIQADRLPQSAPENPLTITELAAQALRDAPQLQLDDILRAQLPGFSLFRRSSSRVANPTTQGVTLRNFGPNGAGRTLVLLDGVPLNDPFAGYVLWNEVPASSLGKVIVQSGGGAGLFGNAALAGTIFLESKEASDTTASVDASLGTADTFQGAISASVAEKAGSISVFAEGFSTGGYPVLQADQRGKVDTDASLDSGLLEGRAEYQFAPGMTLDLAARHFDEDRGNGTDYTRNLSAGDDASAVLTAEFPDLDASAKLTGYLQERAFRSTFSAVDAGRANETPALDQFNVPATAAGGSAVWSMQAAAQHALTAGADLRWVEGETNELFRFIDDQFTRQRRAGGEQLFAGAFVEDDWTISPALTILGSTRLDYWRLDHGFRQEHDLQTGDPVLDEHFADRDGWELNGRLGGRVHATRALELHGAFYSGFRVPTLNELYRPFRVGNDVTEANANLKPERLLGGEARASLHLGDTIQLDATAFYNRLEDAVGNRTIGFGPGTFDPGGFIPEGGVLRQRESISLVTAPGAELGCSWTPATPLLVRLSYLFSRPTVAAAADSALVGNLLPQSAEHTLVGSVEWRPGSKWLLNVEARYSSAQFEDDQNKIPLAPFVVVDAGIAYHCNEHLALALKIENLFDREIEIGKSAGGLVSIGNPRLITLQVHAGL